MASLVYMIMYLLYILYPTVHITGLIMLRGCEMKDTLQEGHDLATGWFSTSKFECFENCEQNLECAGATYDNNSKCWPHSEIVPASRNFKSEYFLYIKDCTGFTEPPFFTLEVTTTAIASSAGLTGCEIEGTYQAGSDLPDPGFTTSKLECFEHCRRNVKCAGATYDNNDQCWPHYEIVPAKRRFKSEYFLYMKVCTAHDCGSEEFTCSSGQCIPGSFVCDGSADCPDGPDEDNCNMCQSTEATCNDNSCIPKNKQCDGMADCADGEDEDSCNVTPCQIFCPDGLCILFDNICDGHPDCSDNTDEEFCDCVDGEFQCKTTRGCIWGSNVCDGKNDCGDNSDETEECSPPPDKCNEAAFVCDDGSCMWNRLICDDRFNAEFYRCPDGSDEKPEICGHGTKTPIPTSKRSMAPTVMSTTSTLTATTHSESTTRAQSTTRFQSTTTSKLTPIFETTASVQSTPIYESTTGSQSTTRFESAASSKSTARFGSTASSQSTTRIGSTARSKSTIIFESTFRTQSTAATNALSIHTAESSSSIKTESTRINHRLPSTTPGTPAFATELVPEVTSLGITLPSSFKWMPFCYIVLYWRL